MSSPLAISAASSADVSFFGTERQPLVTIENALGDPGLVVEIAARHSFQPIGPFYPGVRAAVSELVSAPLLHGLEETLVDAFGLERSPQFEECFLSIVTAPPHALAPIQRLPHFDGTERERLAVLLYLDRAERGGTAFYRQRTTGFESVDAARYDLYKRELEAGIAVHGMPESAYISGDTPVFQQVHDVKGRFNRLIAYRGNTLHCARLDPGFAPIADPALGRLTLNLFLS